MVAYTLLCMRGAALAQDSLPSPNRTLFTGYLRSIHLFEQDGFSKDRYFFSGVHLRLNVNRSLHPSLRLRIDTRSQALFGSAVPKLPAYSTGFRQPGESMDLHLLWWRRSASLAYTNVERFSIESGKKDLFITVGRQRINWGMTLGWNPNDIFQTANPFDPDYLERPGVDGIRIRRPIQSLSGAEFAFVRTGPGRSRGAWRYYGNHSGFDWQLLAGWLDDQALLGAGWSGSLGDWSFRGEMQSYFAHPPQKSQLQFVLESDRLLPKNSHLQLSFLFNRIGTIGGSGSFPLSSTQTTELMPGKWNAWMGWSRDPSIRFHYGVDLFYSSAAHTFILFPQLRWQISSDWQADLFIQFIRPFTAPFTTSRLFVRIGKDLFK